MISKILSTKKSHFLNYAKQNMWLVVMSTVVIAFVTVIPTFMMALSMMTEGRIFSINYMFIENFTFQILAIGLAVETGYSVFKYLNSKPEVDLYHSVPVKKTEIFITRYVFGLISFAIPLIFNILVMYVMSVVFGFSDIPSLGTVFQIILDIFTRFASVYSFVTLGTIVTGNAFMSVCTSLGFMCAPVLLYWTTTAVVSNFLRYYSFNELKILEIAGYTNPIFTTFTQTKYFVIQAVVMLILSYFCFMKRKSENSSNPVAIDIFKPIIKGLGVYGASTLGGVMFMLIIRRDISIFLLGVFLVGFIFHIAFEMLFDNDIRSGFNNLWHFGTLFIAITIFTYVVTVDLFGFSTRIEPISNIKSIEYNDMVLNDEQNIEILYEFMQNAVKSDGDGVSSQDYKVGRMGVMLKVNLNDGTSYERDYTGNLLATEDMISIETSADFYMQAYGYDEPISVLLYEDSGPWLRPYIDFNYDIKSLSDEELITIYELTVSQTHLLTPDYLKENHPILRVSYYDENGKHKYFPIFDIQSKAVDFIGIDIDYTGSIVSVSANGNGNYYGYSLDQEKSAEIIENMTPIYGYYGYYPGYYTSAYKDIVFVYEQNSHSEIGYIATDTFSKIVD